MRVTRDCNPMWAAVIFSDSFCIRFGGWDSSKAELFDYRPPSRCITIKPRLSISSPLGRCIVGVRNENHQHWLIISLIRAELSAGGHCSVFSQGVRTQAFESKAPAGRYKWGEVVAELHQGKGPKIVVACFEFPVFILYALHIPCSPIIWIQYRKRLK